MTALSGAPSPGYSRGTMSATWLLAIITISHKILPLSCHRLITNPYPEREWDSIIVSSDPITIREKTHNDTANEIPRPQKRSFECQENDFRCLYGNEDVPKPSQDQIVDKFLQQYSHMADVSYSTAAEEKENSRNSYWTMVDSQTHNHPYDDKKGWVTLEPVPWSTSKISKWHPNKMGVQQENRPWDYAPTNQRPVQQFWVSGANYHPQVPNTQWGIGSNDIITDNKPSDFPSQFHTYGNQPPSYQPGYPGNYNQEIKGDHPPRFPQNGHPSTYPSNGNGEWVLLSTTKGYSRPQTHRWAGQADRNWGSRKIKPTDISKYHEEDLKFEHSEGSSTGNRKSDVGDANNGTNEEAPLEILYTGSPKEEEVVKTVRRKVRLQVLPSSDSSTSYGGLLEVDSSSQTVDEAQQEDEKLKKLEAIANVKKSKIRGFKLVPTSKLTGKGMTHKNVMTLAAVGAGMIPATMALLVPMALGRKKRSLLDEELPNGMEVGQRVL